MSAINSSSGIGPLIEHSIKQYVKEHGRKPFALILNPAHMSEFCKGAGSNDTILDGISVISSPRFDMPVLVDECGNPFELELMSVIGKITGRSFYCQTELTRATWRSIEIRLRRYIGSRHRKPLALVAHPSQLEELLMTFDAPDADLSLLDGVSIQTDERCNVLHVIDHEGQLRRL
ncbi:hypothetical protein [Paraburkholderia tagetis]|uniref:Uncharacterized protein n=1 Tax=Paraburkholderia tagetis TaxID=2913261 RepID=A0A9X1UIN3_9BURK|nr:hypothetical protein [Paraburkholderia tagetis]MCG5075172.1 hypothetical protein [Paraburkholderia tagetis]